ncbi:substrate-binding periplasmic protein [Motiliproteus sediminis]|uniref:substrate-binding periplasmic protein n=1 Tax=Motiliproteus sediminis TaxID=1468178 RepID=UPI001AEFFB95|nr:transporter substrate-binding domain-containing protein [Motiliproteus sediminis]
MRIFATATLWALFALPVAACPLPDMRVGLHDFPPFYYPGPDGKARGELVELLGKALDELDCQWSSEFYPANRMLANLTNGSNDAAMIIRHPMLEGRAFYGETAVGQLVLKLFHQPDTLAVQSLELIPKGSRVIVRRGYGYNGHIDTLLRPESGVVLVFADTHEDAVELLSQRQGDYLLNYQGPTQTYLNSKGYYHLDGEVLAYWPIYLVLSNRVNRGDEVVAELDRILARLLEQPQ